MVLVAGILALMGHTWPIWSNPSPAGEPEGMPVWSLAAAGTGGLEAASSTPATLFEIPVTVTGYSSSVDQCDSTPFITATNKRVRQGFIALSRDLIRRYTPGAPFGYGDLVEIEGVGIFQVEDTMNRRYKRRADIWFPSRTEARRWGVQHHRLARIVATGNLAGAPSPPRSRATRELTELAQAFGE